MLDAESLNTVHSYNEICIIVQIQNRSLHPPGLSLLLALQHWDMHIPHRQEEH
jgi:hypothetical protein